MKGNAEGGSRLASADRDRLGVAHPGPAIRSIAPGIDLAAVSPGRNPGPPHRRVP